MSDTYSAPPHGAVPSPQELQGVYNGERGAMFALAMKTAFLTLITLGIYRFWAKTRIRRYMWSATAPGGDPFEYTGTGLEKFLGFLVAIVVLAIYLGIVQMALFFAGLNIFSGGTSDEAIIAQMIATYITVFALLPLVYFARYRGRRYLLSRTRWRGIRFGAEPGALGYMLRGIGYSLLTLISFGILLPLQMFKLEKYMVDRTYYGTAKMTQGGKWTMLYGPMKHILIGVVILILGIIAGAALQAPALMVIGMVVGYGWLFVGFVYFGVHSFNLLSGHKTVEGGLGFRAQARTGTVIKTYLIGALIVAGITIVAMIPLVVVMGAMGLGMESMTGPEMMMSPAFIAITIVAALAYLLVFLVVGAAALTFIFQPIMAHYIENVTILNAPVLDDIRQRAADEMADAEGFADALDVGGGF